MWKYKIAATVLVLMIGGCIAHSIEYGPNVFGYYALTTVATCLGFGLGTLIDIDMH